MMNAPPRRSLAWQMILPIPLAVLCSIVAVWLILPPMIARNAADQAIHASRNIAAQFKTIRDYYTVTVVDKIVTDGAFKATADHQSDAKAIPLPATMIHDLSLL